MDFQDSLSLQNLTPGFGGVIEQNLIVDCAIYLKGCLAPLADKFGGSLLIPELICGHKLEIPELWRLTPAVGRPNFDREVGGLYLVPATHFVKNKGYDRQLALSNVVTREDLSLDDDYV